MAQQFGCRFIETSAKARRNVDEAFQELVREIRRYNKVSRLAVDSHGQTSDCLCCIAHRIKQQADPEEEELLHLNRISSNKKSHLKLVAVLALSSRSFLSPPCCCISMCTSVPVVLPFYRSFSLPSSSSLIFSLLPLPVS